VSYPHSPPGGFRYVHPSDDEKEAWRKHYKGKSLRMYRLECVACGKRIWGSGIGIGSHRRACKGAP
jgi:hypothetical protein